MLKSTLIHPEILAVLGRAGHRSRVLIADGNYPFITKLGRKASLVNLNLTPGLVSCTQALEVLLSAIVIERAQVMEPMRTGQYAMKGDPPIWTDYRRIINAAGAAIELEPVEPFQFYDEASTNDVALTIATAEQQPYANILLTIGVVLP
jgi:L-fucose mutarotase